MRRVLTAAVVTLLLGGSLLSGAEAAPTSALPGLCQLAPTVNTWQGLGVGPGTTDDWETDANWSDGAPLHGGDPDVCIPSGGLPRIAAGQEGHVTTLDIAGGATVHVDPGGKLFLYGDQSSDADSLVRSNGRLEVVGGTLGGVSKLHVKGTLVLEHDVSSAATLLTRDCAYDSTPGVSYPGEETCTSPVPTPVAGDTFHLEVDDRGVVDVRGGGVNIGDQTVVVARGLVRVGAGAYLAADHGTRLALRPHRTAAPGTGTLRFEGDGGYLEGKIEADTGIATLSRLVNQGLIRKSGGTGLSLVTASYSQPTPGTASVASGTLLLPTGPVQAAQVAGGSTYGTGACVQPDDPACVPSTTPDFPQSAELRVPTIDTNGARVVVRKLGSTSSGADLGFPFTVHASSLKATPARPALIRMRFDASVLGGKRWWNVKILRKSGSKPYRVVKACTSSGRPPSGEVACVDRRGLAGSSRNIANVSGAPDVLMVVRTTGTSRWVGR
ncbi:hypothetical protein [Nocardioides sp.]|uniref:hypothetical protein n=1 Tax=Nocardioides sp. TaxID=35761 RepID=UPI00352803E4